MIFQKYVEKKRKTLSHLIHIKFIIKNAIFMKLKCFEHMQKTSTASHKNAYIYIYIHIVCNNECSMPYSLARFRFYELLIEMKKFRPKPPITAPFL